MVKFSTKEEFQKLPEAKQIHEIVVSTAFHKGMAAALLHYQDILTGFPTTNTEEKASRFDKLVGAREFLGALLNLTEKPEVPKPKTVQNLNHNA